MKTNLQLHSSCRSLRLWWYVVHVP